MFRKPIDRSKIRGLLNQKDRKDVLIVLNSDNEDDKKLVRSYVKKNLSESFKDGEEIEDLLYKKHKDEPEIYLVKAATLRELTDPSSPIGEKTQFFREKAKKGIYRPDRVVKLTVKEMIPEIFLDEDVSDSLKTDLAEQLSAAKESMTTEINNILNIGRTKITKPMAPTAADFSVVKSIKERCVNDIDRFVSTTVIYKDKDDGMFYCLDLNEIMRNGYINPSTGKKISEKFIQKIKKNFKQNLEDDISINPLKHIDNKTDTDEKFPAVPVEYGSVDWEKMGQLSKFQEPEPKIKKSQKKRMKELKKEAKERRKILQKKLKKIKSKEAKEVDRLGDILSAEESRKKKIQKEFEEVGKLKKIKPETKAQIQRNIRLEKKRKQEEKNKPIVNPFSEIEKDDDEEEGYGNEDDDSDDDFTVARMPGSEGVLGMSSISSILDFSPYSQDLQVSQIENISPENKPIGSVDLTHILKENTVSRQVYDEYMARLTAIKEILEEDFETYPERQDNIRHLIDEVNLEIAKLVKCCMSVEGIKQMLTNKKLSIQKKIGDLEVTGIETVYPGPDPRLPHLQKNLKDIDEEILYISSF